MKRGVDRGFVIAVVVVVVAAVFLSNVRPSVSGMGGTSFDGQGISMTSDTDGYYRGPNEMENDRAFLGKKDCQKDYYGWRVSVPGDAIVLKECDEEPEIGRAYYTR